MAEFPGKFRYRLHNMMGHHDYWWAWVVDDPAVDLLDFECLDCGQRFQWRA